VRVYTGRALTAPSIDMLRQIRRVQFGVRALFSFPPDSSATLAGQLQRHAVQQPERVFLHYGDVRYTYAQANALINRHANAYLSIGVQRGDVVALMLENRPEYLWHVFGLHKLGAVASLLNTQLTFDVLAHAIRVCAPKRVVIGSELWPAFADARASLPTLAPDAVYVDEDREHPCAAQVPRVSALAATALEIEPENPLGPRLRDMAAYIYTSGTTGLPKAALIKHERLYRAGAGWASFAIDYRPDDILYNCLPLYHSNALMLATGSVITAGATMVLARKFSRRHFWDEVRRHEASAFIYIGELCRYLLNTEPSPRDREHRVRVITGNGLRPALWPEFQRRFGIARIAEFYGATEGNCITVNVFNRAGSVGPRLPGMVLARWDEGRQEFLRDDRGFLIRARLGEPGILLGRIARRHSFDGYRDERETERKIIRNAFEPGDAYFNTGDLLRQDLTRHLYFVDRVGDTFRWKGENVSTTEVEAQISKWPAAAEVNAYGVQVPGVEGRAGMIALVLREGERFDPAAFKAHVDAALPAYARPLFVRLMRAIATTATFKMKKSDLQRDGFDPAMLEDALYLRHPVQQQYVRIDRALHADLTAGRLRL
jgi:acyl-CoA synthetase (AMP-forming)/AMP-acid ligase II